MHLCSSSRKWRSILKLASFSKDFKIMAINTKSSSDFVAKPKRSIISSKHTKNEELEKFAITFPSSANTKLRSQELASRALENKYSSGLVGGIPNFFLK